MSDQRKIKDLTEDLINLYCEDNEVTNEQVDLFIGVLHKLLDLTSSVAVDNAEFKKAMGGPGD